MSQHFVQVQPVAPQPPTTTTITDSSERLFVGGSQVGKSEPNTGGPFTGHPYHHSTVTTSTWPNTGNFVPNKPEPWVWPPLPLPPKGRWVWIWDEVPNYPYYPPPAPGWPLPTQIYCGVDTAPDDDDTYCVCLHSDGSTTIQ